MNLNWNAAGQAVKSTRSKILFVEDNQGDQRLIRESFKARALKSECDFVSTGIEALEYLRKQGPYANTRRPDVVILDLNLPKRDGRWVLTEIKQDPDLKTIPVIVLTTSNAEGDIRKSYEANANCFITKPVDLDEFFDVIDLIDRFWCGTVQVVSSRCENYSG